MQKIQKLLPVSDTVRRIASTDPATKTWTCPHCGVIPAKALRSTPGYYIRQSCPCEEHQRVQQIRTRERAERQMRNQEHVYSWVGREWADLALVQKTFETFVQSKQPSAFEAVSAFAQHPHGTLLLSGHYGVGKTHLLAAVANAYCGPDTPCLYVSAVTLFDVIQERIEQNRGYHELLKHAIHTPLLLIDDVDKPKPSEFREAVYYHLIDKRTIANRPLALSSNSLPRELKRWIGDAAHSRLVMNLHPVTMQGEDYRLHYAHNESIREKRI